MKQITLVDLDTILFEVQFHTGAYTDLDTVEVREQAREDILRTIERDAERPEVNPL
jgi:hypothetical protein